jgi:hypothetical protein
VLAKELSAIEAEKTKTADVRITVRTLLEIMVNMPLYIVEGVDNLIQLIKMLSCQISVLIN